MPGPVKTPESASRDSQTRTPPMSPGSKCWDNTGNIVYFTQVKLYMLPELFLDSKDYPTCNFHSAFCDGVVNFVRALFVRVTGSLPKIIKIISKSFKIHPSKKNLEMSNLTILSLHNYMAIFLFSEISFRLGLLCQLKSNISLNYRYRNVKEINITKK